jgi:hypothetical protein
MSRRARRDARFGNDESIAQPQMTKGATPLLLPSRYSDFHSSFDIRVLSFTFAGDFDQVRRKKFFT